MFPLRPGNDAFEDDDVQPDLDQDVVDRLSAYTSDENATPTDPHEAYPGLTDALFENRDLESGEDAAPEPESSEPETEGSIPEPGAPEQTGFSPASWSPESDAASIEGADSGLGDPAPYPGHETAELREFVPPADEGVESELPVSELPEAEAAEADDLPSREPDLLETGEPVSEPALSDEAPAEVAAEVFVPDFVEETQAPPRRSFGRRRGARSEASEEHEAEKKRSPKEKRGAKDRKAKKLVGLKIGASQIVAAEVVSGGAPELVEVFREPLEPGLVVSGEIRDPEALGASLKRLFELHKLPKRGVRLGLANNRIGVRIFEIEGVSDAQQLDNAIRFRAEEVLPIPLDQAVLDYVVLEDAVREDGTPWKRILLVVAYREVVDRYLQACHSAGLEVVGIDLEAFALLRAIEAPMDRGADAGALIAVAIGHDRTTIAVSTGRYCEFTRVLDWGGWSLNVAIARELDKAPSEVEGLKRQLSFAAPTEVEGFTHEQTAKAREAIQRSLSGFVRELVASLQFYQAQPGALGIGEIVLTGGTAHMDGLPDALGAQIGVPIRLGDPFKRIKVGPKVAHEGPRGSLSVAIGLGIED